MSDALQKARDATIQDFEKRLRSGIARTQAINEVLDAHYDRVDRLPVDGDDELEAMEAILLTHQPAPAPRPAAASPAPGRKAPQKPPRQPPDDALLKSPFRFVALNDKVVTADPVKRHIPQSGGYSGTITVEWAAEAPLLIGGQPDGDGVVTPMTLGAGGAYVIPGATIRGCVRAAFEIVTAARLAPVNSHARFGLRDFEHPLIRPPGDESASLLAPRNVRAGWLYKRSSNPDVYEIEPCRDWHLIPTAELPARRHSRHRDQYQWRAEWLKTDLPERYRRHEGKAVSKQNVIDFTALTPQRFAEITTRADGKKLLRPDPKGSITGTLVFSNRSPAAPSAAVIEEKERRGGPGQPKKREYVFTDDPNPIPLPVTAQEWRDFTAINSRIVKDKRKPDGSWEVLSKSLGKDGSRIPVFFIVDKNGRKQIGLTRFFKVLHEKSVGDLLRASGHERGRKESANDITPDMAESLFGHVWEPDEVLTDRACPNPGTLARKGRVAFGFAKAVSPVKRSAKIVTVMAAPRASFAPFYLQGREKDWSPADGSTRLAGRKRYIPRFTAPNPADAVYRAAEDQITRLEKTADELKKMTSTLVFLEPETSGDMLFRGEIRLHNVTDVEIGALLWTLTHGGDPAKPYRHMMGRGKPFGAGQMRVHRLHLKLVSNHKRQEVETEPKKWERVDGAHGWMVQTDGHPPSVSMEPFLQAFHNRMAQQRPQWPLTADMAEFLASSDPRRGRNLASRGRLDYPGLQEFNDIRKSCKRTTRDSLPDPRLPRYLPALAAGDTEWFRALTFPYRS